MAKVTDEQILQLVITQPGISDEKLGLQLGLSRVQVNRRRNSPTFLALLEKEFKESSSILKAAHVKALRRISEAMDSADDRVALKASSLILEESARPTSSDSKSSRNKHEEEDSMQEIFDRVRKALGRDKP